MSLPAIAVPNVSEGRDQKVLTTLRDAIEETGARVLDVHSDAVHHRSVFTVVGSNDELIRAAADLARACAVIDLTTHSGAHPRLGGLDVYPFVAVDDVQGPIEAARRAAEAVWETAGLPVYLYGLAARRPETRDLPDVRRGGLVELMHRAARDLAPDFGTRRIDPRRGVACVGARRPLVAFNVWLIANEDVARRIAARVRTGGGGPPGIRALAWAMDDAIAQVSMNLIDPDSTGIEQAFDEVDRCARTERVAVSGCEIVGLPLERHLPTPQSKAARLLREPGRSLESVLRSSL